MRKTKIICTLGPATEDVQVLRELMYAGMDVARFNFSHGTHASHKTTFDKIVMLRQELDLPIATLLDTKGPEIRIGKIKGGRAELISDQSFTLTTREVEGDASIASISYKELPQDMEVGRTVLIDDDLIALKVTQLTATDIVC
ncbi:MAG: pyruvate kinase, partial [Christensenellaceae bacterium]